MPGAAQSPFLQKWIRRAWPTMVFAGVTAVMTWPQARLLSTHAAEHYDVFFNLWRLRWIAHALATSPHRLFDGNIFYPERGVLVLSDAIVAQGVVAAPLFWIGLPPVLVHNLVLLGGIVASGAGAFALAAHLTGNRIGAIVAGIVYAFAPYRFEHYMHMELQWAVWIPWAFLALQRTLETGRLKYGLLVGIFTALQLLSCIYYAAFLGVVLPLVALVQLPGRSRRETVSILRALALGAAVAAGVLVLYGRAYERTPVRTGTRNPTEVAAYSATPRDYLAATPENLLYGGRKRSFPERRLFPGVVPPLLALVGLVGSAGARRWMIAYVVGCVVAFELSLGMNGFVYPFLYDRIALFQALRAPARAAILGLLFLGVLAALGCAILGRYVGSRSASALTVGLLLATLAEYWGPPRLAEFPNSAPEVYSWLARQPRGVVVEFPVPTISALPGRDPGYAYMSTFHWQPLINGYSGYYPQDYRQRLGQLEDFPGGRTIDQLRGINVRYLIIHTDHYSTEEFQRIVVALNAAGSTPLVSFPGGRDPVVVFRLQ